MSPATRPPTLPLRPLALALLFCGLAAAPGRAQTPCVGGMAGSYPCEGVDLLAHLPRATFGSGQNAAIWGWVDPLTGREYAIVGNESGTAFVDVTEPTAPVYLGKMPTATFPTIWREMRVYADHVLSVSDGAGDHGMQVMDLKRLRNVTSPPQTFQPDLVYHGPTGHHIGSVHTIGMDESRGIAVLNGSNDCFGGPHLVDVTDPMNPEFKGCYDDDGYSHDAICVLYEGPDPDYSGRNVCVGFQGWNSPANVVFFDATDPENPTRISSVTYPNPGYTHQGWFTEDFRHLLVNDEIDDDVSSTWRTIVLDVTDLDNPEFDFIHFGSLEVTDHNLYILGDYAYESNYEGGLHILDLSEIDEGVLTEVGHFDTYPQGNSDHSYSGQWGNYPYLPSGNILANDRNNGLFILRADVLPTAGEPPVPTARPLLSAPAPNPAGGRSTLTFTVPEPVEVVAEVLDLRGRRVALLYEGPATPSAPLTLTVDGADLPAGLYLVRVTGPRFAATRRLALVH